MNGSQQDMVPPLKKRKIFFILLLLLNMLLFFLYRSLPYELPSTVDPAFDNRTLILDVLAPRIKQARMNGLFPFAHDLKPFMPTESIESWSARNRLSLFLPSGKARIRIPLFEIETRNPRVSGSKVLLLDTMHPGSGPFGFNGLVDFPETIFFYGDQYYHFQGLRLVEKFQKAPNTSDWRSVLVDGALLVPSSDSLTLKNRDGTFKEFEGQNGFYRLTRHSDFHGNALLFDYDSNLRLETIRNPQGASVRFEYTPEGLVRSVSSQGAPYFTFRYDKSANLVSVENSSGDTIRIERAKNVYSHRITAVKYFDEFEASFVYGMNGRLTSFSAFGKKTSFTYGKDIVQIERAGEKYWFKREAPRDFTFQDPRDRYSARYDTLGRIVEFTVNDMSYSFIYNAEGNLVRKIIGNDSYEYEYDEESDLVKRITRNGEEILNRVIEEGLVLSEIKENVGEINYTYDSHGAVNKISLQNVGTYVIHRDPAGLISRITHPSGLESSFEWQGGQLTDYRDIFDFQFKLNRDSSGKLIEVLHPLGSVFDMNRFNRPFPLLPPVLKSSALVKEILPEKKCFEIAENPNRTIKAFVDGLRRIVRVGASGGPERIYRFNVDNRLSQVRFNEADRVRIETDQRGRITNYLSSDGNWARIEYYPENGPVKNVAIEKDLRLFEFDENRRLKNLTVNTVMNYNFKYSPKNPDRVYAIEFPDKTAVQYAYDDKGRLESVIFKSGDPIEFEYSGKRDCRIRFPNGMIQYEEYDDSGRVTFCSLSDKEGESIRECNYFYENGRLISGADNGRRIKVDYDSENRVGVYSIQAFGDYRYRLDDAGRLLEISRPDNRSKKFEYNSDKQTVAVLDNRNTIPLSSINISGKIVASKFNFLEINGTGQFLEEKSQRFQIKNFPVQPGANTLEFKGFLASGNTATQNLEFYVHPEASLIFQHGKTGQLKQINYNGYYDELEWSTFNQISTFRSHDGKEYHYRYQPNGYLSSKTHDNRTRLFVYDMYGNLIEEIASTGRSIRKYVYDYQRNRLLLSFDGRKIIYYHTDAFGSVMNITDMKGTPVAEYLYSPYGEMIFKKETIPDNRIGFLGMYRDDSTGLYIVNNHGFYDAENIRFYSSVYRSLWNPSRHTDIDINTHILPVPTLEVPLTNFSLDPLPVPHQASFNHEFLWSEHMNVHPDIERLKTFLTHRTERR